MLLCLRTLGPERGAIVDWSGCFTDRLHICLEFELLGPSLRNYLDMYMSLDLDQIRSILCQVCCALSSRVFIILIITYI